jgi:hypothetical protein
VAAGVLVLTFATPGFAHRLDEYLQATTIAVSPDRVQVEMRFAPGVAVASTVLDSLDTDANGVISALEQRAYAEQVLRDVSLTVDGERVPLRLVTSTFASVHELRRGVGETVLDFDAKLPSGSGNRRLTFTNTHQKRIAAYLVNALVPRDPRIRITSQNRDYAQSTYEMAFVEAAAGSRFVSLDSLARWGLFALGVIIVVSQIISGRLHTRQVAAVSAAITSR